MAETSEIRCGRAAVDRLSGRVDAQHAMIDYLRSLGCRDAEIVRLAPGGARRAGGGDLVSVLVVLLIVLLLLALFGGVGFYRR